MLDWTDLWGRTAARVLPVLCFRQAGAFDSVNFCDPPRGILTLDEDVIISKTTRPDGDYVGDMALVIQGGGQRWKLSSEAPGEINRWEEVGTCSSTSKYEVHSNTIIVHSVDSGMKYS